MGPALPKQRVERGRYYSVCVHSPAAVPEVEGALLCAAVAVVVGGAEVGGCVVAGGAGGLVAADWVVWAELLSAVSGGVAISRRWMFCIFAVKRL